MALRRQLLLMASLTLALPWAGREYVREMESRVRQGQQAALLATAQAVAARIGADADLMSRMQAVTDQAGESVFYAHPLPAPVVVDGYSEEWRSFGFAEQQLPAPSVAAVTWGQRDGTLYGLITVADAERLYYDPAWPLAQADHLLLRLGSQILRIYTAAPGSVTMERLREDGAWVREYAIRGVWNEEEIAYSVELRMPLAWAEQGVGLAVNGLGEREDVAVLPLLVPSLELDQVLAVFNRPGVRLSLLADGWRLGGAGQLQRDLGVSDPRAEYWWVRLLLGHPQWPQLDAGLASGRLTGEEIERARSGAAADAWYLWGDIQVGRAAVPVLSGDLVVVAEQSMDTADTLVSGAFGRLLFYSLLASIFVALVLLAYASILSWRIRRLSRAAQQAVDADGRIYAARFPASRSRDEIGDLTRTYGALLLRLQDYTQYLESLAGKLSHELRTPLAMVRSSLDNLSQVTDPSQQKVYIERASEGLQRLSNTLNAMSAAARLEQSLHQFESEPLDCRMFFGDLARMYQDLHRSRRVGFRWESEGPWQVNAAPELLAQMCDKLMENAADFSGPDGEIELVLTRLDKWVRLQVINTGPPLPDTLQARIFDSLTGTRVGEGQHLGLGLYVVRLIVQHLRGQVRAFNHPGGGRVVFEILLPAA